MIAEFLPPAAEELEEAFAYYEAHAPGTGDAFEAEAQHALKLVLERPKLWKLVTQSVRMCQLRRFPYALVYRIRRDRVYIIAVAHLHRRPGYWRSRRKEIES